MSRDLLHDYPQKIASVPAFRENSAADFSLIQAGDFEQFAPKPGFQETLSIVSGLQISESGREQIEDVGFRAVYGESTGRKQHMI
jgi:hypothetical protein